MRRVSEVDPFIGIDNGGNCLPGPYRPLGMVRPSPDMDVDKTPNTNGYETGLPIARFSQVHVSGTGGGGRYGNISISPYCGESRFDYPLADVLEESASPGYYNVLLGPDKIQVEITCAMRTAAYRVQYPKNLTARLLIDVSSTLRSGGQAIDGEIFQTSPNHVEGWVELIGGWGHKHPYKIFFSLSSSVELTNLREQGLKLDVAFTQTHSVDIQIGVSFISVDKARKNREEETDGKTFEDLRSETEDIWEDTLSRVDISGGSADDRKMHYTMLYRLLAMPSDLGIDDEFPRWASGVRQFNDFFCLWDSCRNANGFLDIAFPEIERDILNCLIDIGEHTGWIPDAWMSFNAGFMQGGCSAELMLSQAAQKDLKGINYACALELVKKNHIGEPPDRDTAGRYMEEFRDVGYVSTNVKYGCASRHLEYTFQDWATARLAECVGDTEAKAFFDKSADQTMELWNQKQRCFFPKTHDGEWIDNFDITQPFIQEGHYSADPYFFEGTAVEWALTPLHVMDQIVHAHGGSDAFVQHLDSFFKNWIYKWKEILLHTPYLYLYADRPDRTADCVLEQRKRYTTQRDGLPDNEDMGSQSTFCICTGIGLYPAMGRDFYWLSPPLFDEVRITPDASGAPLILTVEKQTPTSRYITRATLNGEPLNRAWVRHNEITHGGELHYYLSEQSEEWGTTCPPPC